MLGKGDEMFARQYWGEGYDHQPTPYPHLISTKLSVGSSTECWHLNCFHQTSLGKVSCGYGSFGYSIFTRLLKMTFGKWAYLPNPRPPYQTQFHFYIQPYTCLILWFLKTISLTTTSDVLTQKVPDMYHFILQLLQQFCQSKQVTF